MKKVLLILLVFVTFGVQAAPEPKKIDEVIGDFSEIKETIKRETDLDGSGFFIGKNIDLLSKINGANFNVGLRVNHNGTSEYSFTFADKLVLNGTVSKDAFSVATWVELNGNIKRDAYLLGERANISGIVGRNLSFLGESLVISSTAVIQGDIKVDAKDIEIEDGAKITGKIIHNDKANLIFDTKKYKLKAYETKDSELREQTFIQRLGNKAIATVNVLLIFLVLIAIFPKLFKRIDKVFEKAKAATYFKGTMWSLLSIILVPLAALILFLSRFGIGLSLVLVTLFAVVLGLGSLFSGYVLGLKLLPKNKNRYLTGIVGITIISLLTLIPYFSFIVAILGLAVVILTISFKEEVEVVEATVVKEKPAIKKPVQKSQGNKKAPAKKANSKKKSNSKKKK